MARARRLLLNEDELDALDGLPYLAVVLYIKAIKPYMDYATGITGWKRGISYQSMAEQLYVEPEPGRHKSLTGSPTKAAIRHATNLLEKVGLIQPQTHPKKLIFKCLLAKTDQSVQNRSNTGATHRNDTAATQALAALQKELEQIKQAMSNTPEQGRSSTPPVSGDIVITPQAQDNFKTVIDDPEPAVSGAAGEMKNLIFPKSLGDIQRQAIKNALPTNDQEQAQALIDELAGVMQYQAIKNPAGYFNGIANRYRQGTFVPTAGPAIAEARERAKQEAKEARKRHEELTRPKEERTNNETTAAGRQAMRAALKQKRTEEEET